MSYKKLLLPSIVATRLFVATINAFGVEQWYSNDSYPLGTSRNIVVETDEDMAEQEEIAAAPPMPFEIQTDFYAGYELYRQTLQSNDASGAEARAQVVKLLANSTFNVRTASFLARRDSQTRRWIPDSEATVFVENDRVAFQVSSDQDGYLYVFYQSVEGKVSLLYPTDLKNKDGRIVKKIEEFDNSIVAGSQKSIPDEGMVIRATAPYGCEYLLTLVTNKQLRPEKLRSLVESGAALGGISSADFGAFCKGALDNSIFKEEGDLEYGACRLSTAVFHDRKAKNEYLAEPTTFFVGIGIDLYQSVAIPNLPSCVNDVTRLATTLQTQGAVAKENTLLLTNENADSEHIKYLFSSYLPELLRPSDRLIVHWSSHGMTTTDQMYFVTYDAQLPNADNPKATALISSDVLNQWAYLMPGRETLYLFDCCYSGGSIDRDFDWTDSSFEKSLGGNNMLIIASSSDDEVSLVDRESHKVSLMSKVFTDYIEANPNVDAVTAAKAIAPKVEKISTEQFNRKQHVWWADGLTKKFFISPPEQE